MDAQFSKALPDDYDDVIDLTNYVFSHDHRPHDFPALLPKLYKREYFMDGIHYLAKEEGRIKAVVGAYPLYLEFADQEFTDKTTPSSGKMGVTLPGRGIGMVSVHPYSRGKGYMKKLMEMAIADMKHDGIVFSCLGGQRQRYEHFGFTPAGSTYTFSCNEANLRNISGSRQNTRLSLKAVGPDDTKMLDQIHALHCAKTARMRRQRERIYDILVSMNNRIYAITDGNRFEGYLICGKDDGNRCKISEINVYDLSRLPEALCVFLSMESRGGAQISICPHENEKIALFSRFAETWTQSSAYMFAVYDYVRFAEPFLRLKERGQNLADGSYIFQIESGPKLRLAVTRSAASISEVPETAPGTQAESSFTGMEAVQFLFSPIQAQANPAIRKNVFLQSLLPLPLFFESADSI